MKFINDQYEKYLQEEVNINRKKRIPDTRVHCCLYFIPATGHSYVQRTATPWGGAEAGWGAWSAAATCAVRSHPGVHTANRPPPPPPHPPVW